MTDEELQKVREHTELQFKLMLYKRPEFPFLQSMGTKHLIQEFQSTEQISWNFASLVDKRTG